MAGITLELEVDELLSRMGRVVALLENPEGMLRSMAEYLLQRTEDRFIPGAPGYQTSPDGEAWQALSPSYLRSKKKNQDKILSLNGYLGRSFSYSVGDNELLVGTNRKYAAVHQFGELFNFPARSQQAFFRQDSRSGELGNQFVSKARSNFSQWVTLGPYKVEIPKRPFLGVSNQDADELLNIAEHFLDRIL